MEKSKSGKAYVTTSFEVSHQDFKDTLDHFFLKKINYSPFLVLVVVCGSDSHPFFFFFKFQVRLVLSFIINIFTDSKLLLVPI